MDDGGDFSDQRRCSCGGGILKNEFGSGPKIERRKWWMLKRQKAFFDGPLRRMSGECDHLVFCIQERNIIYLQCMKLERKKKIKKN